jgi:hypothetical protein
MEPSASLSSGPLQKEGLEAHQVAYDKPSSRLLPFLAKHFNLVTYSPQSNHFVVYHEYFSDKAIVQKNQTFLVRESLTTMRLMMTRGSTPSAAESWRLGLWWFRW